MSSTRLAHRSLALLVFVALAATAVAGCGSDRGRIVSAELIDRGDPANPYPADVVIRVTLDREVRASLVAADGWSQVEATARVAPPADCFFKAAPPPDTGDDGPLRVFYLRVISGADQLRPEGLYGGDPSATQGPTGLGFDRGQGLEWVDLQAARIHPVLQSATWRDINGNFAIDRGDRIALVFDRDVKLAAGIDREVDVPGDIDLALEDDRLAAAAPDAQAARFIDSGGDATGRRSVSIELGDFPHLTPAAGDATENDAPPRSRIALHATPLEPSRKIVSRDYEIGAISRRAVTLELPADHPTPKTALAAFPAPGARSFVTATPALGQRIVLAGGMTGDGRAIDQVLVFEPEAMTGRWSVVGRDSGDGPENAAQGALEEGRYHHTATQLNGLDGQPGTPDDLVVIAGGYDGRQALSSVEVVRFDVETARFRVEPIEGFRLRIPRYDHTATVIDSNTILFLGGASRSEDGAGGIVGGGEIVSFEIAPGGHVEAWSRGELVARARTRHTTTWLGPQIDAALVYGGLGDQTPATEEPGDSQQLFPTDLASILASAELVFLTPDGAARVLPLEFPFDYARLRYDHRAARLPEGHGGGGDDSARVWIAGGSLRPLDPDPRRRADRRKWELPRRDADFVDRALLLPNETESSSSLLFTLDAGRPEESTLEILPPTTGELRVQHALVSIPDLGLVVLGGEDPLRARRIEASRGGEILLLSKARALPFTVSLSRSRTRFAAASVAGPEAYRLYLFGGEGNGGDLVPAVEVLRLPR